MLAPEEFTVGSFSTATPLSLILPRSASEFPMLVGHIDGTLAGAILSEQYAFECIEGDPSGNWAGLIIPDVRVEVEETSVFTADHIAGAPGTMIRSDTRLLLRVKRDRSNVSERAITLHEGLPPTDDRKAGFQHWQIVIGAGIDKRILWKTQQ